MERNEKEVIVVGRFTFTRVLCGGNSLGFLYDLKSSLAVDCSRCSANIMSTKHTCRTSRLFGKDHWFSKERDGKTYAAIRRENFRNILQVMLESGQLQLCDKTKRHILANIETLCPAEESHCLRAGDKFQLPSFVRL